jgi:hypothetical protein
MAGISCGYSYTSGGGGDGGQKFGTGRHRRAFACDDGLGMRSERSAVYGATPSGRAGEQFQCAAKTGHDPGELEGAELFCGIV